MKAIINSSKIDITRNNDTLLILGDGRTMQSDYCEFKNHEQHFDIACIGRSIKACGFKADHWFNADGETAIAWAKQIKEKSKNGLIAHTLGPVDGFDVDWTIEQPDYNYEFITNEKGRLHGSSAMFATLAGLTMGYKRIVLAGCPLDSEGHWYFEPGKETLGPIWLGLDFMAWIDFAMLPEAHQVKSMSGYTARILGGLNEM